VKYLEELAQFCDAEIRKGNATVAAKKLAGLNTAQIPRSWRLPLAALCRRAGCYQVGLRLLTKVIYPVRKISAAPASPGEISEYAVLLLRIGALTESASLLTGVDGPSAPEALLYRAFCHFARWEHSEAIPLLRDYIPTQGENYSALVGRVNLAYALVSSGHFSEFFKLADEIFEVCESKNYLRLASNVYAMQAQAQLLNRNLDAASASILEARKRAGALAGNDLLFIDKWAAFAKALETKNLEEILSFRQRAYAASDWDGYRDADYFCLHIQFDQARFERLFFGSPFGAFRTKLQSQFHARPRNSSLIVGDAGGRLLDIQRGLFSNEKIDAYGRKAHQTIEVFFRDLYRPLGLGALFSELFPGEHFNVFTSPDRLHQILHRTRDWLGSQGQPLQFERNRGFYSLKINPGFAVKIDLHKNQITSAQLEFQKLVENMGGGAESFSAKEAQIRSGIPRTSLQRLLSWALEIGRLQKLGMKNSTRYQFVSFERAESQLLNPAA